MQILQKHSALSTAKLVELFQKIDRLSIFSFMWAVTTLFHQMVYVEWIKRSLLGWLLFLSAILLFWRPRSITLLMVMVTLSTLVGLGKMPLLSNHIFLQLCIDLIILLSVGWQLILQAIKGNLHQAISQPQFREEIFNSFAPPARMALIILYFFAVFHKLNWGFFDPAYSHAVALLEETTSLIGIQLTNWMKITSIWATLIIETAIAVMLCLKPTRNVGILLGLAFHMMLSMNPKHISFNSFSPILYALYFLFTPHEFPDRLSKMVSSIYQQWTDGKGKWIIWSAVVAIILFLSACLLVVYSGSYRNIINVFGVTWDLFLGIIFISVTVLYPMRQDKFVTLFRPRWALQWMVPILLILNGFTIYSGLKTTYSFNMFTNLRTEGGETNHFFMSKHLKIASYIDDIVEITHTNHPDIKGHINRRMMTYFEFQRKLQKQLKDYFVEYKRNGKPMRLEVKNGVSTDPEVLAPYPWWQYKIMGFNPIYYGPHSLHQHNKAAD